MSNDWEPRLERFDALIAPLSKNTSLAAIDPSTWVNPVDRVGIRWETEALVLEMMTSYVHGTDSTREAIRDLLNRYTYFAWAAGPPRDWATPAGIRAKLLYFSMCDRSGDYRASGPDLTHIIKTANLAKVDVRSLLLEVARISSATPRYWGTPSTRESLLSAR